MYVAGMLQVGKQAIEFSEESCTEFLSSPELAHHKREIGNAKITITKVDVRQLKNSLSAKRMMLPFLRIWQYKEGERKEK